MHQLVNNKNYIQTFRRYQKYIDMQTDNNRNLEKITAKFPMKYYSTTVFVWDVVSDNRSKITEYLKSTIVSTDFDWNLLISGKAGREVCKVRFVSERSEVSVGCSIAGCMIVWCSDIVDSQR